MVKIINSESDSQLISNNYSIFKVVTIGVVSGLLFWLLTLLIGKYIINNSMGTSGNIAIILVAVFGIIVMVSLRMAQPLIVAVTTAAALWGLAQWTDGLSIIEIILWSVVLYVLSYILFSWITRYDRIVPVLVVILFIVLVVRII